MTRFRTLTLEEAEQAIEQVAGLETIIHDEKLIAIKIGGLRIAPKSSGGCLFVSEEQP
jgi:hypothetical protein